MKYKLQRLAIGLAVAAQALLYQNCSNTRFVNEADTQNNKTCNTDIQYASKPVKILFVVDNSMSNQTRWEADSQGNQQHIIGTDEGKVWRLAVMNSIIDRYGKNSNVSFGLGSFSGYATTPHIHSGGKAIFTNNLSTVRAGVQEFKDFPHQPETPYPSAVAFAEETIRQDIAANPGENASYSVLMVSDGVPSKGRYDNHPELIIPDAQKIMALSPLIRLNSVFYYSPTLVEEHTIYLRNFSQAGKGTFVTADAADTLSIDGLVKHAVEKCE